MLAIASQQEFSDHMHDIFSINKIATIALRSEEGRESNREGKSHSLYIIEDFFSELKYFKSATY